jgi:hypothetical protein
LQSIVVKIVYQSQQILRFHGWSVEALLDVRVDTIGKHGRNVYKNLELVLQEQLKRFRTYLQILHLLCQLQDIPSCSDIVQGFFEGLIELDVSCGVDDTSSFFLQKLRILDAEVQVWFLTVSTDQEHFLGQVFTLDQVETLEGGI